MCLPRCYGIPKTRFGRRPSKHTSMKRIALILILLTVPAVAQRLETATVIQTRYKVEPIFLPVLKETIARLRRIVAAQREEGKLIGFVSIPLSARGGGNRDLNVEISEHIKARLEKKFGTTHFWALAPGLVESSLPAIDGISPRGGEYMYLWTEVLAGPKGFGEQFDLIYFSGPSDFADFFGLEGENDLDRLHTFLEFRASRNPKFAATVDTPDKKRAFLRYYGMRCSVNFSDGAHDEWNIFRHVNKRRRHEMGIGEQIPVYFDGRQLPGAVTEMPISHGYQLPSYTR